MIELPAGPDRSGKRVMPPLRTPGPREPSEQPRLTGQGREVQAVLHGHWGFNGAVPSVPEEK